MSAAGHPREDHLREPIGDSALNLAAHGLPLFACGADKKPLTEHGFKDATRDPATIRWMFSNPTATLIGVPTGAASGFDVLDTDPRHGSDAWRQKNINRLPQTRIHATMHGGEHWLFRHVEGVLNDQSGKRIAPGCDVRGEGGYIIVPPSPGYRVISDAEIADWPDWLLPLALKPTHKPARPAAQPQQRSDQLCARYRGFVRSLLDNVAKAAEGTKHDTLLKQARAIGGIMDAAEIAESDAVHWLMDALPNSVKDWENARKTAIDGLQHGRDEPIVLEDRPRQSNCADRGYSAPPPPEQEEDVRQEAEPEPTPETAAFFDPWEDPSRPDWPAGVLSRQAEETLAAISLRDGVDFAAQCLAYIAAASGAAPKNFRFAPYKDDGWSVPPIFWLMLIAESGQRKTAIMENAFRALRTKHGSVWTEFMQELKQWRALPENDRRKTPKPVEPHSYIINDATVEKLQMILAANRRGTLLLKDELAGFLEFGRYSGSGSAERAFYLEAYEGGSFTVHRVGRDSVFIPTCGLTVFGGIQPDRLEEFKGLEKDGLLQRFAINRLTSAGIERPDVRVPNLDQLNLAIDRIATLGTEGTYTTTPEGGELIRQTRSDGSGFATITDYGIGFQGFCNKLHGTHARLALILHLMENPQDRCIPTDTVRRGRLLVMQHLICHARDFYSALPGSNVKLYRDIGGWLLNTQKDRVLASDLTHNVKVCRTLGAKEIGGVLDRFIIGGWLEPETEFPNNRRWTLQPGVRAAFAERQMSERERRDGIRARIGKIGSDLS